MSEREDGKRRRQPAAPAYKALEAHFARIGAIRQTIELQRWDQATLMPEGGAAQRGHQIGVLEGAALSLERAPRLRKLIRRAHGEARAGALSGWQQANLDGMARAHAHAQGLPPELMAAYGEATAKADRAWRRARQSGRFADMQGELEQVVALARRIGQAKGRTLGLDPYDALLDHWDPGARTATTDPLFERVAAELPDLIAGAQAAQAGRPADEPAPPAMAKPRQWRASRALMRAMGFDFDRGMIRESPHPFATGNGPRDVRITTHLPETAPVVGLLSTLHETGHGLYRQGLPERWAGQPAGRWHGASTDEMMALVMEFQVGRSAEFWDHAGPLLRRHSGQGPLGRLWGRVTGRDPFDPERLRRRVTRVDPTAERIHADEVTYGAHILLRYRMEKALIRGEMEVADLPEAWRRETERLLGPQAAARSETALIEDMHWPNGAWGYFPNYLKAAMGAAQIYEAATAERPEIPGRIARGDFTPLTSWLRARFYGQGSRLSQDEMMTRATGRKLGAEAFLRHLRGRYRITPEARPETPAGKDGRPGRRLGGWRQKWGFQLAHRRHELSGTPPAPSPPPTASPPSTGTPGADPPRGEEPRRPPRQCLLNRAP